MFPPKWIKTKKTLITILIISLFSWYEVRPAAIRMYCQRSLEERYEKIEKLFGPVKEDLQELQLKVDSISPPSQEESSRRAIEESARDRMTLLFKQKNYQVCIQRWGIAK